MNSDKRILLIVSVGEGGSMTVIGRSEVSIGVGLAVFIGLSIKQYSCSISAISSSNWSIRDLFWSAVVRIKDFFLFKVWVRSIEGIVNLEFEDDIFKVDVVDSMSLSSENAVSDSHVALVIGYPFHLT